MHRLPALVAVLLPLVLLACAEDAATYPAPAIVTGDGGICEGVPVCRCERARVYNADGVLVGGWLCLDTRCRPCGSASGPIGGVYRDAPEAASVPEVLEAVADAAACDAWTTAERWEECRAIVAGEAAPDAETAADWIPAEDPAFGVSPDPYTLDRSPTPR